MKVIDLVEKYGLEAVVLASPDREIVTGYCGDLLSVVMSSAPTDSAWLTVMNNVNVTAVASLTDVSCVIICGVSQIDEMLISKAKGNGVNVLSTDIDVYEMAVKLSKCL